MPQLPSYMKREMRLRRAILLTTTAAAFAVPTMARARSFSLYAHAYLDSTRTPAARVTADVPFESLVFFKKEGWFDARYEVYIEIAPQGEKAEPHTAVMRGHAVASSYEETASIDQRAKTSRTFELPPGKYTVTGTLHVKRTQVSIQRSLELEVPDFLASGIGFGSPVVLTLPPGTPAGFESLDEMRGRPAVEAPADASLALFERRPAVRFELFLDAPPSEPVACDVFYEALSPDGQQVLYGKHRVRLDGRDDTYLLSFDVDDWDPGAYRINLRALTEAPVRDASASVVLNVDVTRAMLGRNFDETLEILSLIASDDELRPLRNAPPERRAEAWSRFWAARDPDPGTVRNEALEEHLRRVRYVMKEFSGVEKGWRTDRGQVYIRFGPPDRIERATDSRYQGEYEVWRYYGIGRVFVFYDMFGLGDYRLVQGDMF